jgi:hypothetical protein
MPAIHQKSLVWLIFTFSTSPSKTTIQINLSILQLTATWTPEFTLSRVLISSSCMDMHTCIATSVSCKYRVPNSPQGPRAKEEPS